MQLNILHLYPQLMNIYGDQGNIRTLVFRCQKRGIKTKVINLKPNQALTTSSFDLLFAGGGQDRQQLIMAKDLKRHQKTIKQAVEQGIPMLTICGSYQLFGHYFKPHQGPKLKGISLFNAYTIASEQRKIGNIIVKTTKTYKLQPTPYLIGFENHSGNTYLGKNCQPLGKVKLGFGNNGQDKSAGAIYQQAIGCYLHGSLLPKNPHLADQLIQQALDKKYGKIKLQPLDDSLEWQAHHQAINRTKQLAHPLLKYL